MHLILGALMLQKWGVNSNFVKGYEILGSYLTFLDLSFLIYKNGMLED